MAILFSMMVLTLSKIHQVMLQEGRFAPFGIKGDQAFTKKPPNAEGTTRFITWDLLKPIPAFDRKEKIKKLVIYEFGVISLRETAIINNCPTSNFDGLLATLIAVYWIPARATGGNSDIFYRQETVDYSDKTEIGKFIEEINEARDREKPIKATDIKSAIYITWSNLKPFPDFLANLGNRLSFQIVILSTDTTSYAVNIYRTLDYSRVHDENNPCREQALVGLRKPMNFTYQLTSFFPFKANNILIHTNIPNYSNLGRYVLIIEAIEQIDPHLINCNDEPRDEFCDSGVSPTFCEGKALGKYAHPTICNKFIDCSNRGRVIQDCPPGTGFNPFFLNCDWPGFLRCVDIRTDLPVNLILNTIQDPISASPLLPFQQSAFTTIPREVERTLEVVAGAIPISASHMNTVSPIKLRSLVDILQFAVHNNTCIGLQNASNIIDPTSCNHFFRCTNTRGVRERCPSNLFYEPKIDACEFPHKVNCIQNGSVAIRFNSTDNVTITTLSPLDICSGAKFGFAADPKSCEHYFHCAHGRPFRRKCPAPLYFNSKTLGCDFKHKVQCQNPLTTPHFTPSPPLFSTQPNLVIANISSICQNVTGNPISSIGIGNNGLIPEPGSCIFILRCRNGLVTDRLICPGGSFFDKQKQTCVIGAPYPC